MSKEFKYVGNQILILIIILLLAVLVLGIGLVIGYGVVGDGENPWAILSPDKWQEIGQKFTGN